MAKNVERQIRPKVRETSSAPQPERVRENELSFETFDRIFRFCTSTPQNRETQPVVGVFVNNQFSFNQIARNVDERALAAAIRGQVDQAGYVLVDGRRATDQARRQFKPGGILLGVEKLSQVQREALAEAYERSNELTETKDAVQIAERILSFATIQQPNTEVFGIYVNNQFSFNQIARNADRVAIAAAIRGQVDQAGYVLVDGRRATDQARRQFKPGGILRGVEKLSPEQREALAQVYERRNEREDERESLTIAARIRDFVTNPQPNTEVFGVYVNNQFSFNQLARNGERTAIAAAIRGQVDQAGYVLVDGRRATDQARRQFKPGGILLGVEKLSPEQREALASFYLQNTSDNRTERFTTRLNAILVGQDAAMVDEMRTGMGDTSEERALAETALRFRRGLDFSRRFFTLEGGATPDPDRLLKYVAEFEAETPGEQALRLRYTRFALERKKERALGLVCAAIRGKDFDNAVDLMRGLAESPLSKDGEAALAFTKLSYKAELSELRARVYQLLNEPASLSAVRAAIESFPRRPAIDDLDYFGELQDFKQDAEAIFETTRYALIRRFRPLFQNGRPKDVLAELEKLPENTPQDALLKDDIFEEFRAFVAKNRPAEYTGKLRERLETRRRTELEARFIIPELGDNEPALEYVRDNFMRVFLPLFQSLRGSDAETDAMLKKYIVGDTEDGRLSKLQYVQRPSELKKQRALTPIEEAYLRSVEQLTKFTPYLVALAETDFGATSEYLRSYFDRLSEETWDDIEDGGYVPELQIGTGPNGATVMGEVARYRPDLAGARLVVDAGLQPGGPFAVPGGAAWALNSSTQRGLSGPILPDAPGIEEAATIRAYGSPLRRNPGERRGTKDTRDGGINTAVDWLVSTDDISDRRYPTNEEMQLVLAMHAAMTTRNLALRTRVTKVGPDPAGPEYRSIVTLEHIRPDGKKEKKKIHTDAIANASGLGEPSFGFELEGTKAEKALKKMEKLSGFPKASTTLEGLGALANRRRNLNRPPKTIVLSGAGNSTDVVLEYLGEIFAAGTNPLVRNIEKIYVVAEGDLSNRPRYAQLADLKGRNGKENLIEFVRGRVEDFDFKDRGADDLQAEPIVLFGADGEPIQNARGETIEADAFIANAGFKQNIGEVYEPYIGKKDIIEDADEVLEPIVLPTNPNVIVGYRLRTNPNIRFYGTARPTAITGETLAQYPAEVREALLRNRASEGVVAIGFLAPATQAATKIWVESNDIDVGGLQKREPETLDIEGSLVNGDSRVIERMVDPENLETADNVPSEEALLSSLLTGALAERFPKAEARGARYTGSIRFSFRLSGSRFSLELEEAENTPSISRKLFNAVEDICENEYFQSYALKLLRKRGRNRSLDLVIKYQNGRLNLRETFVAVATG